MLENFAKRFNQKKFFEELFAKNVTIVKLKKFISIIDLLKISIKLLNSFVNVSNSKKFFAISFKKSRKIITNIDFQLRDELIYHVKKNLNYIYLAIVSKKFSNSFITIIFISIIIVHILV